jgi:hypothetical protein
MVAFNCAALLLILLISLVANPESDAHQERRLEEPLFLLPQR